MNHWNQRKTRHLEIKIPSQVPETIGPMMILVDVKVAGDSSLKLNQNTLSNVVTNNSSILSYFICLKCNQSL